MTTGRRGEEGDEQTEGAAIISMDALTREATFRRLAELARRTDPPPAEVKNALDGAELRRVSGWRSIDDELASLVYDSENDPEPLANVRSLAPSRRLTFEAPDLTFEVEVTLSRPRVLVCQVVPAQHCEMELRQGDGVVVSKEDAFGTFHFPSVRSGPLALRCLPGAERTGAAATSWFRI